MTALAKVLSALLIPILAQELPGQVRFRGRVTGPDGAIAGAVVRVETQADPRLRTLFPDLLPPPRQWTAVTDSRGTFSLSLPAHSLYRAYATDAGGGRVSLVQHDLRAQGLVRLLMLRGSRPRIQRRSRDPLAYQILGRHRETQREFTIQRGILAPGEDLPLLPPGPYRIRLRTKAGRAAQSSFVLHPAQDLLLQPLFHEPAALLLEGVAKESLGEYRVRLPESLRFGNEDEPRLDSGFALPAFDLLLRIEIGRGAWESRQLGRIQPGNHYLVAPPRGPGREIRFETPPLPAGAHLLLLWHEGHRTAKRLVSPGRDGRFPLLGRLPKKDILVLFQDGDGRRSVQLAPAEGPDRIRLHAGAGSLLDMQIQGEVPLEEFHPKLTLFSGRLDDLPEYTDLYPPSVHYADRRGRIRIPSLPAGNWEILVEASRHVSQWLQIRTGPAEPRIEKSLELALGYRLHGRVLGPASKPLAGVLVKLSHPLLKRGLGPLVTQSDSEGRYLFEGLPDARFNLDARTEIQGHTWSARHGQVAPGAEARDLVLEDEDPVPPDKRR